MGVQLSVGRTEASPNRPQAQDLVSILEDVCWGSGLVLQIVKYSA